MIVHSIHVQDFLSHADSTVHFTDRPLWLISGENGAGKSAFFDALEYALYGFHRAKRQQPELLVRNGADVRRASIVVCFELDGQQFQLSHVIDARDGNQGGRLQRLVDGAWQEVNVGSGRLATWRYLERRLPPWELFRSAVFLRQGDIDRFLQGSAANRVDRFAKLIDLSRYSKLSKAATDRMRRAATAKHRAAAQRELLGDVSSTALTAARSAVSDAERACENARAAVKSAEAALAGANSWAGVRTATLALAARRERVRLLLADADAIQEAAARVTRWDQYAPAIGAVWQNRARAIQERKQAAAARTAAETAEQDAKEQRQTLTTQTAKRDALEQTELPAARAGERRLREQAQALGLERQIAGARAALADGVRTVETLAGADTDLTYWQTAERALPLLDTLVQARREAATAQAAAQIASDALATRQSESRLAEASEAVAYSALESARARLDIADRAVQALERDEATLQDRITRRETVGGDEDSCPMCAQPLDEEAHAHLQVALADDRTRLIAVHGDLARANADKVDAASQVKAATDQVQDAARAREKSATALALAEQAQANAQADITRTAATAAQAERAAHQANAADPEQLAAITAPWQEQERRRVTEGLAAAKRRADQLVDARGVVAVRKSALTTLQGQRGPGAATPGDSEGAEALTALTDRVQAEAKQARATLMQLEAELSAVNGEIARLGAAIARVETQAQASQRDAEQADGRAMTYERDADEGAATLGPAWASVLDSDSEYRAERAAVDERRPLAARAPELHAVAAEQADIDRAAAILKEQTEQLDPGHKQPVAEAQAALNTAVVSERAATQQLGVVKTHLKRLEDDHKTDMTLAQTVDASAEEESTYRLLADLLKEGGPIQAALAGQEQRRIVEEVNSVLERLGDTLRARLGETRRAASAGVEDIHIVETLDPSNAPRFFEYLSGGEQFRIALALALALHRRVGKQAGTLIVDEGFGALDSRRRHELAARLTDTTDAILDQGLAHSIIICSHSEEVQQQFPDRWHVQKLGDAATVTRITADE